MDNRDISNDVRFKSTKDSRDTTIVKNKDGDWAHVFVGESPT
jgi:hypothetical protein